MAIQLVLFASVGFWRSTLSSHVIEPSEHYTGEARTPVRDRLAEVPRLPPYTVLNNLGGGMTGWVKLVRLPDEREVALKCSYMKGHPLIGGFVHMLDAQASIHVPRLYDYYKVHDSGDCVFMEVTGPSWRQLRKATTGSWPTPTIASIGLQMIKTIRRFHNEFDISHRDTNPDNLVIGRAGPGESLSSKAMFIDFDFGSSLFAIEMRKADVTQILVSLRYLFDESGDFWQVSVATGQCVPFPSLNRCSPAPKELCEALMNACTSTSVEYDYIESMLLTIITNAGLSYEGDIIWTPEIVNMLKGNLDQSIPL